jgi:hypothetical protein
MPLPDNRPSARLGDVEFEFEFPLLDKTDSGRKVEHELLPASPDDDGETVVQSLGADAPRMTLSGSAYRREANDLDDLTGEIVQLRHPRFTGEVFVDGLSTAPQEAVDGEGRWYQYSADLVAVE